jgi:hypothetical protein
VALGVRPSGPELNRFYDPAMRLRHVVGHDLPQEATQEFIDGLSQSNPSLRATGGLKNTKLSGRNGLMVTLTNVSETTGRGETVTVFTTLLRDDNLFYCIAVAPQDEYQAYQRSFQRVAQSIRLTD